MTNVFLLRKQSLIRVTEAIKDILSEKIYDVISMSVITSVSAGMETLKLFSFYLYDRSPGEFGVGALERAFRPLLRKRVVKHETKKQYRYLIDVD